MQQPSFLPLLPKANCK